MVLPMVYLERPLWLVILVPKFVTPVIFIARLMTHAGCSALHFDSAKPHYLTWAQSISFQLILLWCLLRVAPQLIRLLIRLRSAYLLINVILSTIYLTSSRICMSFFALWIVCLRNNSSQWTFLNPFSRCPRLDRFLYHLADTAFRKNDY